VQRGRAVKNSCVSNFLITKTEGTKEKGWEEKKMKYKNKIKIQKQNIRPSG